MLLWLQNIDNAGIGPDLWIPPAELFVPAARDIPCLMNYVSVTIKQLNKSLGLIDPDYRDVAQKTYGIPFTVNAQINYFKVQRQEMSWTGDRDVSEGRIVFRAKDLEDAGIELQKGDIITSIAGEVFNYKIVEERYHGFVFGGANLLHYDFMQDTFARASI